MARKTIRLELRPTTDTFLVCVHCGKFRTDFALVTSGGVEPSVGMHRTCLSEIRLRERPASTPPESPAEEPGATNPLPIPHPDPEES